MRIDTCMFDVYLFVMGVGVGISFWCVLKLCEWHQSFFWNFWGPPNLLSSCDNNYSYVKHVFFKHVIFWRYAIIEKPLRIHAKSLCNALAPFKKNCLRRWPAAALRCFRIYSWSAHCLPDFCQKGWWWWQAMAPHPLPLPCALAFPLPIHRDATTPSPCWAPHFMTQERIMFSNPTPSKPRLSRCDDERRHAVGSHSALAVRLYLSDVVRCLLITESPKTPHHYRYQI